MVGAQYPKHIVVEFETGNWYLVEAERAIHGTWEHIAPQISRQLTAILNPQTLNNLISLSLEVLQQHSLLREALSQELSLEEISFHGRISDILRKSPIVAIPIDEIPDDLEEWANTLKHVVKIWRISKYVCPSTDDILYSFPEDLAPDVSTSTDEIERSRVGKVAGQVFTKIVLAGLVSDGQKLWLEYGPRGQPKQRFEATVRPQGIEVDGRVYSPSYAAVACMKKAGSERQTANGWIMWRTEDGEFINELYQKLSE